MSEHAPVDVLLFEVAGVRYGVELAQVRRIDRVNAARSVGAPLGLTGPRARALVFEPSAGDERQLPVDRVLGVRGLSVRELRRLPAAAAGPPSLGAWLDGEELVLLVDLLSLVPPQEGAPHGQ